MENGARNLIADDENKRGNRFNKKGNSKLIIGIAAAIVVIAIILGGFFYYQSTHFNSQIKINGINIGGLTADQALKKLGSTEYKNVVYIGEDKVFDGEDTKIEYTDDDLPNIKKLLKSQRTWLPSSKAKEFELEPSTDASSFAEIKQQLQDELTDRNKSLTPPKDAQAELKDGKIIITKSEDGKQYDIDGLLKQYEKQQFKSEIHLEAAYITPIKEDNQIVKQEEQKLQELLEQTIDYKVQDKTYALKGSDVIKNATITKDLKITVDPGDIENKVAEINDTQSTLNKNFSFKTHTGSVIQVKGQGYGWALNEEQEAASVQKAFENGDKSLSASNIYGNGWTNEGIGYETTGNNGIGDTYAEVSLAEQKAWIYKNGKLVVTTDVVTGRHNTNEDTHPGVWYILYKRTPYTLKGTSVGHGGAYEVEVDYWAPFTNDGQGFHDASWRTNWASDAYLTAGSGGCVNTPANIMKKVYDNLDTYEPVIVY
ncbi:L,D-transpeptidase [Niallia taxi]|uniref:L,D-transpeptidase n=1 Tax=Niallia taxi TaxID=2499688 RepID=UPI00300855A6